MTRLRSTFVRLVAPVLCSSLSVMTTAHGDIELEAPSLMDALKTLPCEAFQRDIDGAWILVARIRVGESVLYGDVWRDTRESKILDARCGQK